MPVAHHEREWPDKVVFSALLLMAGGLLGAFYAALRMTDASINVGGLILFDAFAPAWILSFSAATFILGLLGYRYQAWVWCTTGAVTAVLSMGFFGLVPLLGLAAGVLLIVAAIEGEEMKHDEHTVPASQWPDKAIIASLLLTILGLAAFLEAMLLFADRYSAPYLDGSPALLGVLALAVTAVCLVAARQSFRQQKELLAWVGTGLGVLLAPFWIIGPILGISAMVFLGLAGREQEFDAPTAT